MTRVLRTTSMTAWVMRCRSFIFAVRSIWKKGRKLPRVMAANAWVSVWSSGSAPASGQDEGEVVYEALQGKWRRYHQPCGCGEDCSSGAGLQAKLRGTGSQHSFSPPVRDLVRGERDAKARTEPFTEARARYLTSLATNISCQCFDELYSRRRSRSGSSSGSSAGRLRRCTDRVRG